MSKYKILFVHLVLFLSSISVYHFVGGRATVSSPLFDIYILCVFVFTIIRVRSVFPVYEYIIIFLFLIYYGGYILTAFNYSDYIDYYELIRSSRFVFYLLFFIILSNYSVFHPKRTQIIDSFNYKMIYYFLLVLFFLFYAAQVIVFSEFRPKLFGENNYEIPALLIISSFFEFIPTKNSASKKTMLFTYLISLISLSKSGILELFFYITHKRFRDFNIKKLIYIIPFFFIIIITGIVMLKVRSGDQTLSDMDRVRFLMIFIENMDLSSWLFGHGLATRLPVGACIELKYWASSISDDYWNCTSTVYHSFILKLIYDMGMIGLLICLSLWFFYLKRSFGAYLGRTIFGIVLICSLSVTGFSNSIVIWPIFMALLLKRV
jgi:hypothetical protein